MNKLTVKNPLVETRSPFWQFFVLPLLRYRRMTYAVVASATAVTLIYCLVVKNQYTSTASILPTSGSTQGAELKDLAMGSLASLGLGAAITAPENSSALYPKILSSRLVSERLIERTFPTYCDAKYDGQSLERYLDAPNRDLAIRELRSLVAIDTDRRTGVTELSATTTCPELSAAIVHAYLEELNDYNVHRRQSSAGENVKFVAGRLKEIETELAAAEDTLRDFQERNLNFATSGDPELILELARLQRQVELKSTLYASLSGEHERARIEAVKDIPIVQVLDPGAVPVVKSAPRRTYYMAAALAGSLVFSVFLSVWRDLYARRRFRDQLEDVAASPELRLGRFETRLLRRVTGLPRARPEHEVESQLGAQ
jgi:uncharacterized protein involved in exopolysaccharide biosynthesis